MLSQMVGPWRRSDYESFIKLDSALNTVESSPIKLAGLMGLYDRADPAMATNQEAQQVEKAWAVRKGHPIYQWLQSNLVFGEIWRLYEKRRYQAAPNSKIASPNAPFLLLNIIVEYAGLLFELKAVEKSAGSQKSTYGATGPRRQAAVRHADALIKLSNQGVNIRGIEGAQFRHLLVRFRDEIKSIDRKPRGGKGSSVRTVLELTAFSLVSTLGLSSPAILENFAALAEANCDNKTAQRIFRRSKKNYSNLLAQTLREFPGQLTPQN